MRDLDSVSGGIAGLLCVVHPVLTSIWALPAMQALLRRVFGTAVDLWQEEVGFQAPLFSTRAVPCSHMCPTFYPEVSPNSSLSSLLLAICPTAAPA